MEQHRKIIIKQERAEIDPELAAEMAEDKANFSEGSGTPTFKVPEDGMPHAVRVLPGTFGRSGKKWYVPQAQHWVQGPRGRMPYDCPAKGLKQPCPFCEGLEEWRGIESKLKAEMKASPSKACRAEIETAEAVIKNCLFRVSYALNVISREEESRIVRKFSAPKTVFSVIESYYANHGDAVLDGYEGWDFLITRKKVRGFSSYDTRIDLRQSSIGDTDQQIEDAIASINDLEAGVDFEDYDKLKIAYDAMVETVLRGEPEDGAQRNLGDNDDDFDQTHRRGGGGDRQGAPANPPAKRIITPPARRQQTAPVAESTSTRPTVQRPTGAATRVPSGSTHPDDQIKGAEVVKVGQSETADAQPKARVSLIGRTPTPDNAVKKMVARPSSKPAPAKEEAIDPGVDENLAETGEEAEAIVLDEATGCDDPQSVPSNPLMERLKKIQSVDV
jgi:hypothetical protein